MNRQRARLGIAAAIAGVVLAVAPDVIANVLMYYVGPLAILAALAYAVRWHDEAEHAQDEIWMLRAALEKQPRIVAGPELGDLLGTKEQWAKVKKTASKR